MVIEVQWKFDQVKVTIYFILPVNHQTAIPARQVLSQGYDLKASVSKKAQILALEKSVALSVTIPTYFIIIILCNLFVFNVLVSSKQDSYRKMLKGRDVKIKSCFSSLEALK
jgi:hypothetical protein